MISFEFSVTPIDESIHEFDLGDLKILSGNKVISSSNGSDIGTMMVFVSVSDLLFGVGQLIESVGKSEYEFVGADSSFVLKFENNGKGRIKISNHEGAEIEAEDDELGDALCSSAKKFYEKYAPVVVGSGAAINDLEVALKRFRN